MKIRNVKHFPSGSWVISVLLLYMVLAMSSCSSGNAVRSKSKYSSANKRTRVNNKPVREDEPVYVKKEAREHKNSGNRVVNSLRTRIVESATSLTGTNYRFGGKSPETGFDCSGFTGYIFSRNGIPLSGPSDALAKKGRNKSKEDLGPGDLVFFGDSDRISHVAIVASHNGDSLTVIHATTSAGVKVDNINGSAYWESRFLFGRDILSD